MKEIRIVFNLSELHDFLSLEEIFMIENIVARSMFEKLSKEEFIKLYPKKSKVINKVWLLIPFIEREFDRIKKISNIRIKNGKKGAMKRWKHESGS